MNDALRGQVDQMTKETEGSRLTRVLQALGVAASSWYCRPVDPKSRKKPGPAPKPVPLDVVRWVVEMARRNPWYGYKKIAVMCRRADQPVSTRQAYRVMADLNLLHHSPSRRAELYQAAKLFELLPNGPDDLWQMDVTHVHIPGHGWWYAVTVMDYYSRYLLAAHLTPSYCATEVIAGLQEARREAERLHGPLTKPPFLVTDNGCSFVARRFAAHVKDLFTHVRIQYRTPTQLGLLERFHRTLKEEEIYWRMNDNPAHARECIAEFRHRYNTLRPHWALVPEEGGDPVTPHEVYVEGVSTGIPRWQGWSRAAKAKLEQMMLEAVA